MLRNKIQSRIRSLREELDNRYKYGTIKLADLNGNPISIDKLQNEMYSLIYKLSKLD